MMVETLALDRVFPGVGRIKRRTGTTDPVVKRKISRMLTTLYEDGRLDLLRMIRDGKLTPMQVYDAFRRKALGELPSGDTVSGLQTAMTAWLDSLRSPADYSAHHIANMESSLRRMAEVDEAAKVSDLPAVLDKLRDSLGRKHPRAFNVARSAAMAFVRATLKRNHPLWLAVAAVEPRKVPKSTKRRPLTLEQMQNWFPNRDSDPLDALAWCMATTGMHQEEYWGKWETLADRVLIHGKKREGRDRAVPLVLVPPAPFWAHRRTFENKLRDRTKAFTPYDLRRTYANWLESAGIPRTRRRLYMGHGAGDVTDLYEQHEVSAFLAEDAAKLREFLGLDGVAVSRLKAVK